MSNRAVQLGNVRLFAATLAYGVAFIIVHRLSAVWATSDFYSIWFPPAGLRFATLWLLGARTAPLLALSEFGALYYEGVFSQPDLSEPLLAASIICPCLAYGAALAFAKRLRMQSSSLKSPTLRFGVAAALAPVLGFAASVPWHVLGHERGFTVSGRQIAAQAIVFIIGDLLGILLLAPPILDIAALLRERRWPELGSFKEWVGTTAVLGIGAALVVAVNFAGFGIRMLPMILAAGIIGVLFGRIAAWVAVVATSVAVLWLTAGPGFDATELALHLQLAAVVLMGTLAGAYSSDQRKMREEIRGRDVALLHAERLKTLRAMSLAVIHELSQPLSTLSIETNYLARLTKSPTGDPEELRTVSELIAQKTENLATMLRRLRTFGAAQGEQQVLVDIEKLLRNVVAIIAPEARAAGVRIEMRIKKGAAVLGYDVELQQAVTNLLRNAIAASPGGTVRLAAEASADQVRIDVANTPNPDSPYRKGMGVGKLIVEAIAEMHGGALLEHQSESGERRMCLALPTASMTMA